MANLVIRDESNAHLGLIQMVVLESSHSWYRTEIFYRIAAAAVGLLFSSACVEVTTEF